MRMYKGKGKVLCAPLVLLLIFSIVVVYVVPVSANGTKIYVDPPSIVDPTLTPGKTFTVSVKVFNVTNLYGLEYMLSYDTSILDIVEFSTPPFLKPPVFLVRNETNDAKGWYWYAASSMPPAQPVSGSGTVATLKFQVTGIGKCVLELHDTGMVDSEGNDIVYSVENGYFDNRPPPPPALIFVNPPRIVNFSLVPCENFEVNISIIDANYLYSFEFKLGFDPDVLNVASAALGDIFPPGTPIVEINNTAGYIRFSASFEPPQPEVSGNGTLAIITFHVEDLGVCKLTLYDTVLADEEGEMLPHSTSGGYFNNVFLAQILVDPPSIIDPTLYPPDTFTINISIANVTDMYDYAFKLGYDTSILNCLGVNIIPFENEIHFIPIVSINDAAGFIYVNVTYFDPAAPITTTLPIAFVTIKFLVTGLGSTVFDLYDTQLSDFTGASIPHEAIDGYLRTQIRDVAILSVEPSTNATYVGWLVNITVVVGNEGDVAETFDASAYYDNNLIGTRTVTNLPSGENKTLVFTWNTAGVQPCFNYTIKARANAVPYETDLIDNVYIDGKVKVKMFGDVNGDRIIDIQDIVLAALAFGSRAVDNPKTPQNETKNWNPNADLKVDGAITIADIVLVALNYGKTC